MNWIHPLSPLLSPPTTCSHTSSRDHSYPCLFHKFRIISPSPFISIIAALTHFATSTLDGGLIVLWMTPSTIIQFNHCFCIQSLNGLLKPTSTGWQREAHPPPGMCFISMPSSLIICTTNAIMWHQYISRIRMGITWSGAVAAYGANTSFTHTIITTLTIQAASW